MYEYELKFTWVDYHLNHTTRTTTSYFVPLRQTKLASPTSGALSTVAKPVVFWALANDFVTALHSGPVVIVLVNARGKHVKILMPIDKIHL